MIQFTWQGTKSERASSALITIGPAILNGGATTILALSLLGFSKSYAYIVFFKVIKSTVQFSSVINVLAAFDGSSTRSFPNFATE